MVCMLADEVLHDKQIIAHVFLVHLIDRILSVFMLFEVNIPVVKQF